MSSDGAAVEPASESTPAVQPQEETEKEATTSEAVEKEQPQPKSSSTDLQASESQVTEGSETTTKITESIAEAAPTIDNSTPASQVSSKPDVPKGRKGSDPAPTRTSLPTTAAVATPAPVTDKRESSSSDEDARFAAERKAKFATGKDYFCWICHRDDVNISCIECPRSYHVKCIPTDAPPQPKGKKVVPSIPALENWTCTECKLISDGEERRTSPDSMLANVSEETFINLLKYALQTIKQTSEPSFHQPVSHQDFPEYRDFILHPMDFLTMEKKVRKGEYKSTDAFLADVKWILHNCYIFNDVNHILTKNAKYFIKVAANEMSEIEVCPDCFSNFYVYPKTWFSETCSQPHTLVWARLKGHPFWPAKVVRVDREKKESDCRFFGAHDRAWVSFDSIFLLNEQYPWTKSKGHKTKLDSSLVEVKTHLDKLEKRFPGLFQYAAPKAPFNPLKPFLNSKGGEEGETSSSVKGDITTKQEETDNASGNNNSSIVGVKKNNKPDITKTNQLNRRKGQQESSSNTPSTTSTPQQHQQQQRKRSNDSAGVGGPGGNIASSSSPGKRQRVSQQSLSQKGGDDHDGHDDEDDEDEKPLIIDAPLEPVSTAVGKRKSSSTALAPSPAKKVPPPATTQPPPQAGGSRAARGARGGNASSIPVSTSGITKPLPSSVVGDSQQASAVDGRKRGRGPQLPQQQLQLQQESESAGSSGGRKKVIGRSVTGGDGNHADHDNDDTPDGTNRTASRATRGTAASALSIQAGGSNVTTASSGRGAVGGRGGKTPSSSSSIISSASSSTSAIQDKHVKKSMANSTPSNGSGSLLSPTKGTSRMVVVVDDVVYAAILSCEECIFPPFILSRSSLFIQQNLSERFRRVFLHNSSLSLNYPLLSLKAKKTAAIPLRKVS